MISVYTDFTAIVIRHYLFLDNESIFSETGTMGEFHDVYFGGFDVRRWEKRRWSNGNKRPPHHNVKGYMWGGGRYGGGNGSGSYRDTMRHKYGVPEEVRGEMTDVLVYGDEHLRHEYCQKRVKRVRPSELNFSTHGKRNRLPKDQNIPQWMLRRGPR